MLSNSSRILVKSKIRLLDKLGYLCVVPDGLAIDSIIDDFDKDRDYSTCLNYKNIIQIVKTRYEVIHGTPRLGKIVSRYKEELESIISSGGIIILTYSQYIVLTVRMKLLINVVAIVLRFTEEAYSTKTDEEITKLSSLNLQKFNQLINEFKLPNKITNTLYYYLSTIDYGVLKFGKIGYIDNQVNSVIEIERIDLYSENSSDDASDRISFEDMHEGFEMLKTAYEGPLIKSELMFTKIEQRTIVDSFNHILAVRKAHSYRDRDKEGGILSFDPKYFRTIMWTFPKVRVYLASIVEDSHAKYFYRSMYLKGRDVDFQVSNGKILTPDYTIIKDGVVTPVEYKTTFRALKAADRDKIKSEAIQKYLSSDKITGKDIIPIVHIIDISRPTLESSIYPRYYTAILTYYNKIKHVFLNKIDKNHDKLRETFDGLDEYNDISEQLMSSLKDTFSGGESILNKDLSYYKSTKDYARDVLKGIGCMDKFMKYKHVLTEHMVDFIPEVENVNVNIEDPYNINMNKFNMSNKYNIPLQDTPNNLRPTFLMHFPAMIQCSVASFSDLEKAISAIRISDNINKSKEIDRLKSIMNILVWNDKIQEEVGNLKKLQRIHAFIRTEANTESLSKYKLEFSAANVHDLQEIIKDKINEERKNIENKIGMNVKITKHGNLRVNERTPIFRKSRINFKKTQVEMTDEEMETIADMLSSMEAKDGNTTIDLDQLKTRIKDKTINPHLKRPIMGFNDYFYNIDTRLKEIEDNGLFDPVNFVLPDFTNAYPTNPSLNKLSDELAIFSVETINEVTSTLGAACTIRIQKLQQSIIMAGSRSETKYYPKESIILGSCHYNKISFLLTPPPNELVSGAIILFGTIPKEYDYVKTLKFIGPIKYVDLDNKILFYSRPFRINLQAALDYQNHLYGAVNVASCAKAMNLDLYRDNLYWSLTWNFSRSVKWALDILYLYDKSSFLRGGFGRDDLAGKFEIIMNDVRAATIIGRIKGNQPSGDSHRRFSREAYESTSTRRFNQLAGIKHYVFNVNSTGWYSSSFITYMKQLLAKVDGADPAQLMSGFFKNEIKYETWYRNSPFHPTVYPEFNDNSVEDFYDRLFKHKNKDTNIFEKNPLNWTEISYHPGIVYSYTKEAACAAKNEGYREDFLSDWQGSSLNTDRSSKVNVPSDWSTLYGIDEKTNLLHRQQQKYTGINSIPLTEALLYSHHMGMMVLRHGSKIKRIVKFNPEVDIDFSLVSDRQLTLQELTLCQVSVYGKSAVLTMKLKDQRDYGKRAFFIQLIFNRNANRIWDYVARSSLLCSVNKSDVILIPGRDKNLEFQRKMKELGLEMTDMAITSDMTKYGDTYLVQSMRIQIKAWVDATLIDVNEFLMIWYFSDCLSHRVTLMPMEQVDKIRKVEKILSDKNKVHKSVFLNGIKHIVDLQDPEIMSHLNSNKVKEDLADSTILSGVENNFAIHRESGGTLGVFNVVWSSQSMCHVNLMLDILSLIFIGEIYAADTHSDDYQSNTRLKVPDKWIWESNENYLQIISDMVLLKGIKFSLDGDIVVEVMPDNSERISDMPADALAQMILAVNLVTPRFFSQRPSLAKVNYGIAKEMLQQISSSSGQIYVPIIRYIASVGSDLPGKSLTQDTLSASGRVYDLLTDGAASTLVSISMVIVNKMVGDRFGLDQEDRDVNLPMQMKGLFWALPHKLLRFGFASDEGRKMTLCYKYNELRRANQWPIIGRNPNLNLPNIYKILYNTNIVWNREKVDKDLLLKKLSEKNRDQLTPEELISLVTETSSVEGTNQEDINFQISAVENMVDWFINETRVKKTTIAVNRLKEMYGQLIKSRYKSDDLEESIDRLIDELGPLLFVGSDSTTHKVVSVIKRYLSRQFQSSYVRTTPDTKMVGRLGYLNRLISNPFSYRMRILLSKYDVKYENAVITINDTINGVYLLSSEDIGHSILDKILEQNFQKFMPVILYINGIDIEFSKIDRHCSLEDVPSHYIKIKNEPLFSFDNTRMTYALAYIIDKIKSPQVSDQERLVFQLKPEYMNNNLFSSDVSTLNMYLSNLGLINVEDISQHVMLILARFQSIEFKGIVKLPMASAHANHTANYLKYFTFWDNELQITTKRITTDFLANVYSEVTYNILSMFKPLILGLWTYERLSDYGPVKNLFIRSNMNQRKLVLDDIIDSQLRKFNWSTQWVSELLTLLLWNHNINRVRISMKRFRKGSTADIIFKINQWSGLRVRTKDIEDNLWTITCYGSSFPIGFDNVSYIQMMSCFISAISLGKRRYISGLSKIKRAKRVTKFARFNNELIFRPDANNLNFDYLEIEEIGHFSGGFNTAFSNHPGDIFDTLTYGLLNTETSFLITPWDIPKGRIKSDLLIERVNSYTNVSRLNLIVSSDDYKDITPSSSSYIWLIARDNSTLKVSTSSVIDLINTLELIDGGFILNEGVIGSLMGMMRILEMKHLINFHDIYHFFIGEMMWYIHPSLTYLFQDENVNIYRSKNPSLVKMKIIKNYISNRQLSYIPSVTNAIELISRKDLFLIHLNEIMYKSFKSSHRIQPKQKKASNDLVITFHDTIFNEDQIAPILVGIGYQIELFNMTYIQKDITNNLHYVGIAFNYIKLNRWFLVDDDITEMLEILKAKLSVFPNFTDINIIEVLENETETRSYGNANEAYDNWINALTVGGSIQIDNLLLYKHNKLEFKNITKRLNLSILIYDRPMNIPDEILPSLLRSTGAPVFLGEMLLFVQSEMFKYFSFVNRDGNLRSISQGYDKVTVTFIYNYINTNRDYLDKLPISEDKLFFILNSVQLWSQ